MIHSASMPARAGKYAAALAALALAACTTIGVGMGELRPGNTPVEFDWSSDDGGMSGLMSARLGTGAPFTGTFMQITQQERSILATEQSDSWPGQWDAPGGEVTSPPSGLTTLYSGNVEADLTGADGARMQCHFALKAPASGMNGGGQGECQLGEHSTIAAVFHGRGR